MNQKLYCTVIGSHGIKYFVKTSSILLILTGATKVISLFGGKPIIWTVEPITLLPFGAVLLFVGIIEIALGIYICFSLTFINSIGYIMVTAMMFLIYRLALWIMGIHGACPCLGNITDWLPISQNVVQMILKAVLAFWLFGSAFFILACSSTKSAYHIS